MLIKAYVCSCRNGLRTSGCCVHVATLIYYLTHARYHSFNSPATHLNRVLINIQNRQHPSKPTHCRIKRRSQLELSQSESSEATTTNKSSDNLVDSSDSSCSFSEYKKKEKLNSISNNDEFEKNMKKDAQKR